MKVYLGADHRGFEMKEVVKQYLVDQKNEGLEVEDVGALHYDEDDDFVDMTKTVVEQMDFEKDRAILLCGSGHGMDMAANKIAEVRAILGFAVPVVEQGRAHEDANVLVLPAEWISSKEANEMVELFLKTPFSDKERYVRRLEKMKDIQA